MLRTAQSSVSFLLGQLPGFAGRGLGGDVLHLQTYSRMDWMHTQVCAHTHLLSHPRSRRGCAFPTVVPTAFYLNLPGDVLISLNLPVSPCARTTPHMRTPTHLRVVGPALLDGCVDCSQSCPYVISQKLRSS